MKRVFDWLRAAWMIAGATLVCVLVADRLLLHFLPPPTGLQAIDPGARAPDPEATEAFGGTSWASAYFAELRAARHTRWEPYSYWRREAFAGEHININTAGIRRSWRPAEARLKLLMFGGSTVWGTGSRDEHTLPSELARALAARGLAVEVVNLGETGYVSGQEVVALLGHLRTRPAPDAVVFYDGVNDVYAALQTDRAGIPQNEIHRERDFRVTDGLDNWLAAFPDLLEGVHRLAAALTPPIRRPVPDLAAEIAGTYLDNVRAVRALASEFGFEAWFFWQPSVFGKSPRTTDEELILRASLVRHRDLQRATDEALAARAAGAVIDLSSLFAATPEPLFIDFCHLSESGNRRVAERIAEHLYGPLARMLPEFQPSSTADSPAAAGAAASDS